MKWKIPKKKMRVFCLNGGFVKRKCVFLLKWGICEEKTLDFRVKWGILEEKTRGFRVKCWILEEKTRGFRVKWGFAKRKCVIFA